MHLHKLMLCPGDPRREPPPAGPLMEALAGVGLAGAPFPLGPRTHYLAGPRFLDLVVFLGCSPFVQLEPPQDSDPAAVAHRFCHLTLRQVAGPAVLVVGDRPSPPRCPDCRTPVPDWRAHLADWRTRPLDPPLTCARCGGVHTPAALDWRQSAGAGRRFLELWGIHTAEAVPSEELMETLAGASGGEPWRYFYVAETGD